MIKDTIKKEPVMTAATITPIVLVVVRVVESVFGVEVDAETQTALVALLVTVLPIALAYVARQRVTPVSSPFDNDGVPLVPVTYFVEGELDIAKE